MKPLVHTLLLEVLSRPPLSRLSPSGPLADLSPSFLSLSFLSDPRRLSLFLSPVTDPELVAEGAFLALLVPFALLAATRPLLFLSGDGGAESLDPVRRPVARTESKHLKNKGLMRRYSCFSFWDCVQQEVMNLRYVCFLKTERKRGSFPGVNVHLW